MRYDIWLLNLIESSKSGTDKFNNISSKPANDQNLGNIKMSTEIG